MIRLLLDENISPALVRLLADIGVYSKSVPHVGLAGRPDRVVWQYALDHDLAVVTTNARDFIELPDTPVHPGLIVLRESGLSKQEQWEWLRPVVEHVKNLEDADFLLNKLRDPRLSRSGAAECSMLRANVPNAPTGFARDLFLST